MFTIFLHRKQFDRSSIYFGMWSNFKSPLSYVYEEFLGSNVSMGIAFVITSFLVVCQLFLATMHLTAKTEWEYDRLSWALEFIPLWIMFAMYIMIPIFYRVNKLWLLVLIFIWIPFVCLFIPLTLKIHGQDFHTHHRNISLTLIFTPFWMAEGFILFSALAFLIQGITK